MWRYYELLTDVSVAEIERMKAHDHPMDAKKALARRIVQDFHSESAAKEADANWAKQFQKDEVPENVETVAVKIGAVTSEGSVPFNIVVLEGGRNLADVVERPYSIPFSTLLRESGLADSASDGVRKVKQNAVHIEGRLVNSIIF